MAIKKTSQKTSSIRSLFFTFLLLLLVPASYGLGGGSTETADVPIPAKNYAATIVDRAGSTIQGERLSIDGKIYLKGLIGRAEVNIPFDKIKSVSVEQTVSKSDRDYLTSAVILLSGEKLDLLLAASTKVYGEASYGKFSLGIRDLQSITFKP